MPADGCLLCAPDEAAVVFSRRTVWTDRLWRLSVVEADSPVAGFGHLEPIRHIAYLSELDGPEAATLGPTLARVCAALKAVTGADLVYVYVFGERVAHLHFNLAPHRDGDALLGGPGLVRADAQSVPADVLVDTSRRVQVALSDGAPAPP